MALESIAATLNHTEAMAAMRLLVAVAKADDHVHDDELKALEAALAALPVPVGATLNKATLDNLFAETHEVADLLAEIESQAAKEQVYLSMYSMAYADGDCSPVEQSLLDHAKEILGIGDDKQGLLDRLYSETKDTVLLSNITAITDPAKRATEIQEDTLKYAILSAVLGAFPVPGIAILTDLAVIGLQVKLVRDIGQYHGHTVDKQAAKTLLGALGVGTGVRLAVNNIAKLLPGWGSVVGASTSFASTFALGKIASRYFEGGAKGDPQSLREDFQAAEKEGKAAYEKNKAAVEEKRKANEPKLQALADDVKAGRITQDEYQTKVAAL